MSERKIEYRFDEDELFGYDPDDRVGTDVVASKAKYVELVKARLAEGYPDAELDIREINEMEAALLTVWGFRNSDGRWHIIDSIEHVYEGQEWMVDSAKEAVA